LVAKQVTAIINQVDFFLKALLFVIFDLPTGREERLTSKPDEIYYFIANTKVMAP